MVSEMSRDMMLHLSLFWKNIICSNLRPIDTSYDTYIYNHMTNAEDIVPADIFTGTKFPRHKLKYLHMWVFSVYVLDPTLQQGCKLLNFHPWSCCGIFCWVQYKSFMICSSGTRPRYWSYLPKILSGLWGLLNHSPLSFSWWRASLFLKIIVSQWSSLLCASWW